MRANLLGRRCQKWTSCALLVSMALGGCGYTSTYVAPRDGRPRAVWHEDRVVVEASDAALTDEWADAIEALTSSPGAWSGENLAEWQASSDGHWQPRYCGPPIVVPRPDLAPRLVVLPVLAPRLPLRPLFVPGFTVSPRSKGLGIGLHGSRSRGPHLGAGRGVRFGGGGRGGGAAGGGGDAGKAAIVLVGLAVVAVIVLPAISLGMALADPEDAGASARAIDEVNAWNDLGRSAGLPCDWVSPGEVP